VPVEVPSAGKTSRALELASAWNALRLTPDEWMIPLFGREQPEGKRNVLEGRLIWLALSALRIGVNVVLDFGVWAKVERSALRALAASVGATSELVYLQVDEEEQWRRVQARALTDAATTFEMTRADLERWRPIFQPPDATELGTADSTAHPRASILGKPGWLSGGQRPSPATDLHDTCSTDLRSMLSTCQRASVPYTSRSRTATAVRSSPCADGPSPGRWLCRNGKDEQDAHPRVPCGQTSRVAERLGSGGMSLAEVVAVVPSVASWSAGWQCVPSAGRQISAVLRRSVR
jgi:predicted kinase